MVDDPIAGRPGGTHALGYGLFRVTDDQVLDRDVRAVRAVPPAHDRDSARVVTLLDVGSVDHGSIRSDELVPVFHVNRGGWIVDARLQAERPARGCGTHYRGDVLPERD